MIWEVLVPVVSNCDVILCFYVQCNLREDWWEDSDAGGNTGLHTHHLHNITALELVNTSSTVKYATRARSDSRFKQFREWTRIWIVKIL